MALRDAEIERYSRQIILPEIGGRGQERLRAAVVALHGTGELATIAARYLVGAGVGVLHLDAAGLASLGDDLRRLNPEVRVDERPRAGAATAIIAADLALPALDACVREARAQAVPLTAAACAGDAGWLHAASGDGCAGCTARAVASIPRAPEATRLAAVATGVLGSLLALAGLECALGLEPPASPLLWFAAETSMLTPRSYPRRSDCAACGP
ncbi:hypothetical protein KF840_11490 [bacterium]|nr:hypothetical protein [bacterium]